MKLKKIYVEITNQCNLSCAFCIKTKRKPEFVSEKVFEQRIKKIAAHTNYIYMHVMGEPLLHEKIDVLLDICEQYGINANITTNGTLISKAAPKLMNKPAFRQINFSLHSILKDDIKINDVLEFIEEQKENKYITIRLWNIDKAEDLELNKSIIKNITTRFDYTGNIENLAKIGNGVKLSKNVFLQLGNEFIWPDADNPEIFLAGKCYGLKDHVGILVDGTVVPCCLDSGGTINLGNIDESPLQEILFKERPMRMKQGFANQRVYEKFCRTCGFWLNKKNLISGGD